MTSGGDAPGMNAIVAGACEQAEALGAGVWGIRNGFAGLVELRTRPVTAEEAREHLHESGTWLGTSRWPALRDDDGRRAGRAALRRLGFDGLLVIGGHGSAIGARALTSEIPVAFVPATIDGDVPGTDATIGMDSAVRYAVDVVEQLRVTGRSLPGRAFLLQTLGAPTGLLAGAVAIAARVDHVLVPERPYDLDAVARALRELAPTGCAVAVMSEAVGDAVRIGEALAERAAIRVHPTILGHAQRAAPPSKRDIALGRRAGAAAVDALGMRTSSYVALRRAGSVTASPLAPDDPPTRVHRQAT